MFCKSLIEVPTRVLDRYYVDFSGLCKGTVGTCSYNKYKGAQSILYIC